MGGIYSGIVFQPPPSTYIVDDKGIMKYPRVRKVRGEYQIVQDDVPAKVHTVVSKSGANLPVVIFDGSKGNGADTINTPNMSSFPADSIPYTILYAHGNAEDLGIDASYVEQLSSDLKCITVAYDYTGYGAAQIESKSSSAENGGSSSHKKSHVPEPSESNFYKDADAIYNYCVQTLQVPSNRLIVCGRSLGSGTACYLASKYPVAGLLLISGLASCIRVVMDTKFTLAFDMFANIDRMKYITCPVMIVHGNSDEVVPREHADMNIEELRKSRKKRLGPESQSDNKTEEVSNDALMIYTLFLDRVGHNDMELMYEAEMHARYNKFLDDLRAQSLEYAPIAKRGFWS